MSTVDSVQKIEHQFYIAMDPNFYYPDGNDEIQEWVLQKALLINKNNKVIMVGNPFSDKTKLKTFRTIIN